MAVYKSGSVKVSAFICLRLKSVLKKASFRVYRFYSLKTPRDRQRVAIVSDRLQSVETSVTRWVLGTVTEYTSDKTVQQGEAT